MNDPRVPDNVLLCERCRRPLMPGEKVVIHGMGNRRDAQGRRTTTDREAIIMHTDPFCVVWDE